MKIKKGDTVVIIAGKDKGKTAKVVRALPRENKLLVEGVHVVKKHARRTSAARAGQIIEKTMPIHASNVQIADPKTGKPSRIRISKEKDARVRVAVKSGTNI